MREREKGENKATREKKESKIFFFFFRDEIKKLSFFEPSPGGDVREQEKQRRLHRPALLSLILKLTQTTGRKGNKVTASSRRCRPFLHYGHDDRRHSRDGRDSADRELQLGGHEHGGVRRRPNELVVVPRARADDKVPGRHELWLELCLHRGQRRDRRAQGDVGAVFRQPDVDVFRLRAALFKLLFGKGGFRKLVFLLFVSFSRSWAEGGRK